MALRVIWHFMDRDVTHKILYGSKRSEAMNYLLYYTQYVVLFYYVPNQNKVFLSYILSYMQICQTTCFCYCISKTKNEFGQNSEENIILIGPGPYTKLLTGQYTKILSGFADKDK